MFDRFLYINIKTDMNQNTQTVYPSTLTMKNTVSGKLSVFFSGWPHRISLGFWLWNKLHDSHKHWINIFIVRTRSVCLCGCVVMKSHHCSKPLSFFPDVKDRFSVLLSVKVVSHSVDLSRRAQVTYTYCVYMKCALIHGVAVVSLEIIWNAWVKGENRKEGSLQNKIP